MRVDALSLWRESLQHLRDLLIIWIFSISSSDKLLFKIKLQYGGEIWFNSALTCFVRIAWSKWKISTSNVTTTDNIIAVKHSFILTPILFALLQIHINFTYSTLQTVSMHFMHYCI